MSIFDEERARRNSAAVEKEKKEKKDKEREDKLAGIEFEGVMCSVHKEDQWGLHSVEAEVRAGASIPFHFKNGNILLLTPENVDSFKAVWLAHRYSFFQPPEDKPEDKKPK